MKTKSERKLDVIRQDLFMRFGYERLDEQQMAEAMGLSMTQFRCQQAIYSHQIKERYASGARIAAEFRERYPHSELPKSMNKAQALARIKVPF